MAQRAQEGGTGSQLQPGHVRCYHEWRVLGTRRSWWVVVYVCLLLELLVCPRGP